MVVGCLERLVIEISVIRAFAIFVTNSLSCNIYIDA